MTKEIWKPLYDFPWYEISNLGNVRRTEIRKLSVNSVGYNTLHLSYKNHQRTIAVHRAVWEAFNERIAPELMINHKNGIKTDNRIENLELVTNRENIEHYKNNLLTYKGERVNTHKLTTKQVLKIRHDYKLGIGVSFLMKKYKVSKSTVTRAINGRTWKHVT